MSVGLNKIRQSLSGQQSGSFYRDLYQNFRCTYPLAPQFHFPILNFVEMFTHVHKDVRLQCCCGGKNLGKMIKLSINRGTE